MAYSYDFREKALILCHNGLTDDQVSAKMGVSKQSLSNWKKLLFTTGTLHKNKTKRKPGKPYKYTPDKIGMLLEKSKTSDAAVSSSSTVVSKKSKKKKKKMKF